MQDSKHRNYDYVPTVSRQEQSVTDLLNEIKVFIRNTKLDYADLVFLNKLMKNIERKKVPNKILRSLEAKFTKIRNQYQK